MKTVSVKARKHQGIRQARITVLLVENRLEERQWKGGRTHPSQPSSDNNEFQLQSEHIKQVHLADGTEGVAFPVICHEFTTPTRTKA